MPNEIPSKLLLKERELISVSHLAHISEDVWQQLFPPQLPCHFFSWSLIVRLVCIVFYLFIFSNDFVVKFLLLSFSAFVNIRVRSALRAFCPSRGTSSVKNGHGKGGLDNQGGVSQYNTLLYTPPPPIGWKAKFANYRHIGVVVVVLFCFCNSRCR